MVRARIMDKRKKTSLKRERALTANVNWAR